MARVNKSQRVEALEKVPLFSTFAKKDLVYMAKHMDETTVPKGQVLTKEGRVGIELLVLIDGKAKVERDGKKLATLSSGDVIGELSLIDGEPRSATVTAVSDCHVLVMHVHEFYAAMENVHEFEHKLLKSLAARLREADKRLVG